MNKIVSFLFLLFIILGCTSNKKSEVPERFKELENLISYSADTEPEMKIAFHRERSFGSSDKILIGILGNIAVDDLNRVFIGDSKQYTIHVFDSTGSYVTNIGREGRGPGEFRMVGNMSTTDHFLNTYDVLQRRVNVFSLDSLKLSHTVNLNRINTNSMEALNGFFPGSMRFIGPDKFLVGFSSPIYSDPSHPKYNVNNNFILYYLIDTHGNFISDQLYKQEGYRALTVSVRGEHRFTQFEFLGAPLLSVSNNNEIYTARTNDFLIEVRDLEGNIQRAFYYPIEKQPFTREEAISRQKKEYPRVIDHRASIIHNAPDDDIPQYWPVLDDMLIDDKNRLWVATVVENDEVYEWWVLEKTGELFTKFKWPRDKPIEEVKNGYLYTRETDERGVENIVKYEFEMK